MHMASIRNGFLDLIGNTPLVEVKNIEALLGLEARVLVKLEYFNPAGSVKDRAAKYMIETAEKQGILKEGSVIIEPTSGNTGIGLAAIGASKGYKVIIISSDYQFDGNYKKEEMCMVGDQLMTDVFGGNRFGCYTILVDPLGKKDLKITSLNRTLENMIIKKLSKKGILERGKYYGER